MTKEKLLKYFNSNCNKKEAWEVELWLASIKDNSREELLLKEIFDELKVKPDQVSTDKAYSRFEHAVAKSNDLKKNKKLRFIGQVYRYAAAILLLPLIITSVYFYQAKVEPKEWIEEYVPYGQNKIVNLPDGSKVWLNAGTKFIYPKKFNKAMRQVYVAGEAYAEVAKDKKRPFIMSAGEVNVEVLGTKFNVKSYTEDNHVAVSLIEGSVKMHSRHDGVIKSTLLKPGEIVKFTKHNGELLKSEFVGANRQQWYNGQGFYFVDESLKEIVVALERYFDVRIIIENEALKQERYYSVFVNNESLEDILTALNANGKMKLIYKLDRVYIY